VWTTTTRTALEAREEGPQTTTVGALVARAGATRRWLSSILTLPANCLANSPRRRRRAARNGRNASTLAAATASPRDRAVRTMQALPPRRRLRQAADCGTHRSTSRIWCVVDGYGNWMLVDGWNSREHCGLTDERHVEEELGSRPHHLSPSATAKAGGRVRNYLSNSVLFS
jgi:hypothetical protein